MLSKHLLSNMDILKALASRTTEFSWGYTLKVNPGGVRQVPSTSREAYPLHS